MDAETFCKTLQQCVNHYKKLLGECGDDQDIAHFFDAKLKKFLKDNKRAVDILFSLKFNLPFSKFVEGYIWKESNGDKP